MKVAVSILSKLDDYENAVKKVNTSLADFLHLDIMDNTFTNSSSFSFNETKEICKLSEKKVDIHIMSTNLDDILDGYIKLKPYMISIHYEAVKNIEKYIDKIKKNGIKVSIAINPDTNLSEIYEYLSDIDNVLIMSVYPGFGGQSFIDDVIFKLEKLYEMQKDYNYTIEVDGGINEKTINSVNKYADIVVSGSFITASDTYDKKIEKLK